MAPQKKQGKKGGPQKPELWYVINFGDCKEAYLGVKQLRSANKKKINPDEVTVGVNLEAVWGGKYYVGTVERVSIVEPKLTKKEREVRTQVEREKESKKVTKQTKKKIDALRKKQVDKTRRMIREKIRRQHEDQEDEDQEDEDQEDEDQEDEDQEDEDQEEGEEDADQEEEEGEEGEEDADQEDVENGKRGLKRSREVEKETEKEKAKKPKKLREQGEGEEGTVDQRLERLEKKCVNENFGPGEKDQRRVEKGITPRFSRNTCASGCLSSRMWENPSGRCHEIVGSLYIH